LFTVRGTIESIFNTGRFEGFKAGTELELEAITFITYHFIRSFVHEGREASRNTGREVGRHMCRTRKETMYGIIV
jgi:hypothetical protein